MTPNRTGIFISLALHGGAIALVFALSSSLAQTNKPTEIDFTIVEPGAAPSPPGPPEAPKQRPEPSPAPKKKFKAPMIEEPRPVARQSAPVRQSMPLEPATQHEGSVPVLAAPAPVRQPPSHATQGAGGGSGSPFGSSRGSGGGGGNSPENLGNSYRAENFAYIKRIIEDNLKYPSRAQRLGWSGHCVVQFLVERNGHAKDIRIIKSTGYELLDDNVIETIQRVDPFPRPPVPVRLTIPFNYQLS